MSLAGAVVDGRHTVNALKDPRPREHPMSERWTRREAFAYFDAVCANPRWSWSAKSLDGKTVVLTMWKDEIASENSSSVYESSPRNLLTEKRPGFSERLAHLKWARDNCDSRVRVVILKKDSRGGIAECFPAKDLIMRITSLDEKTGAFRACSEKMRS